MAKTRLRSHNSTRNPAIFERPGAAPHALSHFVSAVRKPTYKTLEQTLPSESAADIPHRMMNTSEEYGEEELNDYIVQLSIQDSCQDAFLKSAASLAAATDENLRVLAAIEQGEVSVLREMLRHTSAFSEPDCHGWLPLHRAASQPVLGVLETVLTSQVLSLEERTAVGGETPLTLAVKAGLVQNVKCLLEHGSSPHNTNNKNESPLLLAVRVGSYEMTYTLVAHGAWVEQVCRKKWTAVHEAAKVANPDILMLLLRNGGRVNEKDASGVTPLAVAAEHGHFHITEILLNCGSRVNSQALNGESVLLDAAGSGNTACIQLLLDNGANPNLSSITGHLPIHKAAYAGHYDALKMLIPLTTKKAIKEAGQSPVHSAAEGGHRHCLQLLLSCGFDVNYRMSTRNSENYRDMRRSALYFAVSNGDVDSTKVLLVAGAKTDLDPLCCLLVAVRSGRCEIVKLLLAAKADVNCYFTVVSDTVFPTALQYCLKDEVMMRMLLNNGYKVEKCFHCHHDTRFKATDDVDGKIPFCEFMSLCCLMHLSGSVVRILLDYISHVHICSKLRLILEKQREWPEICEILSSPRVLRHLCRLVIRRCLTLKRLNNPEIMNSHVFPPRLKSFILYQELDLYNQDPEHII
ncbi:ankyrin repeat and SOCS box protein 15 isoform X2 [Paralichthys olivaceus]|uniref:ankyrin repeat and SOCS box protein 15 isoform X2 n=1 Tax=Paralichthys olivaceus TaxID=8255 RepID=UPI0037524334